MDENRVDELRRRLEREPKSREEEEQRELDHMELMIATVSCNREEAAKRIARRFARLEPKTWKAWIAQSERDPVAWRVCQHLVGELLQDAPRDTDPAPPPVLADSPLMHWALRVAQGLLTEPKPPGRDPIKNFFRNYVVASTVQGICDIGIRPATSNKPGWSACHLVADRLGLSYEAVRTIWRRAPRVDEDSRG